ncbi:MAG: hypothetical protein QG651_1361, partial [Pseudomonadota bacterium]|nr:hypothetical protein [Pseudomonadota bacterium]
IVTICDSLNFELFIIHTPFMLAIIVNLSTLE